MDSIAMKELEHLKKRRSWTLKQLAYAYDVSVSTMRRWLRRMGFKFPRERYFFTKEELRRIFEKLGPP